MEREAHRDLIAEPLRLGPLELPNRIAMAALRRGRADDHGVPDEHVARYFAQRATAGVIVAEGASPSHDGYGHARTPGLFDDDQEAGWKGVAEAVHAEDGLVLAQLVHHGRLSHPENLPGVEATVAPSAVRCEDCRVEVGSGDTLAAPTPRALTESEIERIVGDHARSALRARRAGLDGVEIDAADGHLADQFLDPTTNLRDDAWGGSPAARAAFLVEVVRSVAEAIGPDRVGVRVSPFGARGGMTAHDEIDGTFAHVARELSDVGIAYLHVVDRCSAGAPDVPAAMMAALRERFSGALVCTRAEREAHDAPLALEEGGCDVVAFEEEWVANPDLVARLWNGTPLAPARERFLTTPGPRGYTDYRPVHAYRRTS